MDFFNLLQLSSSATWSISTAFTGLLMAFIVGISIAVVYIYTFQGFSFSRNFVHSLVLSPIVTAIAMMAIDGSLARGIGMMGTFSILRFRSNIRDPRDMFFLFANLALGIACGVSAIHIAFIGLITFSLVIIILSKMPLSVVKKYDGVLRFSIPISSSQKESINNKIEQICRSCTLISLREGSQGEIINYAYQIKFKKNIAKDFIVEELKKHTDLKDIQLMLQEESTDL